MRRKMMRRAYNKGNYQKAIKLANSLIKIENEEELAFSVLLRSHFNLKNYQFVIQLFEENPRDDLSHVYHKSVKASGVDSNSSSIQNQKTKQIVNLDKWSKVRLSPGIDVEFNSDEIIANFYQVGNVLWMRYPEGWIHWVMPDDYTLESTHPDLLRLASEVLLSPWWKTSRVPLDNTRKKGSRPGLAFSAGVDSTAASLVMPGKTVLGYHQRSFDSLLDHRNALRLIDEINKREWRDTIVIESDHELIRTTQGKQVGFSTDFASSVHLILLADYLDLGSIAFGMPIDNTWLKKGRKFRRFEETHYWNYWSERFSNAGLDLFLPIAGISEAGALMICKESWMLEFLNSCLRGDGTQGCGKCWKCFHKNGPLGRPFDPDALEINRFLERRPLPTATHALWAMQQMELEYKVPDLAHLFDHDFSWWTKIYPPMKDLLPDDLREEVWSNLTSRLEIMTEPYAVESVNHFDE